MVMLVMVMGMEKQSTMQRQEVRKATGSYLAGSHTGFAFLEVAG